MTDRRESAIVALDWAGRADRYIAEEMACLSRSQIKSRGARILVNGKEVKPSHALKPGDRVELSWIEGEAPQLEAEDLPLDILFENDEVIVLNKAAGMVTHPANGHWSGTLVNALLGRMRFSEAALAESGKTRDPSAPFRPGIVHRLDRDTSGVIIVAKDQRSLEFLAAQFRERRTAKQYLAVVQGHLSAQEGRIEGWMRRDPGNRKLFCLGRDGQGRFSLTNWRLKESFPGAYALLSLFPRTGRTHQLRVHLRSIGCPILGDPLYGRPDPRFPRVGLMLHAYKLKILLPGEGSERVFSAPPPPPFMDTLALLRRGS